MKSSTEIKNITEYWFPKEYNMRHVLSSKSVNQWSRFDLNLNIQSNQILQVDFLRRSPLEVIEDARLTQQEWLPDFVLPKLTHLIRMNIAAKLVCFYQVEVNQLREITETLSQKFEEKFKITDEDVIPNEIIYDDAKKAIKKIYPNLLPEDKEYKKSLSSFVRVQTDKYVREYTNQIIREKLDKWMPLITTQLKITMKPTFSPGENNDYIFIGAMGSGKSSLAKHKLTPTQNLESVLISTDNYRSISFGLTYLIHSNQQLFTKTQDTAYMIKELVIYNLTRTIEKRSRPNIIIDAVSFDLAMNNLLLGNKKTTIFVACLGDASQAPLRVYQRAINSENNPADKDRYINTEALIHGHAKFSERLLTNFPKVSSEVTLYNTNTYNRIPEKIGSIDAKNHVITINNLHQVGIFLGKRNLNSYATSRASLYYDDMAEKDRFRYTPRHHAAAILSMLPKTNYKAVLLQTMNGKSFANITVTPEGQFSFGVIDVNLIHQELKDNEILIELVKQTSKYHNKEYLGRKLCQKKALEDLYAHMGLELYPAKNKRDF